MTFAEYNAAMLAESNKFLRYVANAGASLLQSFHDEPRSLDFAEHCALMYQRDQAPQPMLVD